MTALKRRRTDRADVVAQLGRLAELIPLATRDRRLAAAADAHGAALVQL